MKTSKSAWSLLAIATALFAGAVLWRNFFLFENFCQKSYDLGIFLEILRENAKGEWNPWLNTRQIHQFSDHWSMIMSLISRFSPFGLLSTALVGEVMCFVLAAGSLFWLVRLEWSASWLALVGMMFFLNRDQFEAAYFPIHESTWAVLPLLGLGVLVSAGIEEGWSLAKKIGLVLLSLGLCLFSEQFGFAILGLGLGLVFFSRGLILSRDRLFGGGILLIGGALIWWLTVGREAYFTPIFPYYQQRILISPDALFEKWRPDFNMIKSLVLHILGYLPGLIVLWKHRAQIRGRWRGWIILMGLFGPLILGRLIAGNFHLQYSVALTTAWTISLVWLVKAPVISKRFVILSFLFLLVFSNNKLRKPFATAWAFKELECARGVVTKTEMHERRERLNRALGKIKDHSTPGMRILAAGNLIPNLLLALPQAEVFQLGSYAIVSETQVDWIFLETEPFGESHYLRPEGAFEVVKIAKEAPGAVIFEDSEGTFMARGPFDLTLFSKFYHEHPADYLAKPGAKPGK